VGTLHGGVFLKGDILCSAVRYNKSVINQFVFNLCSICVDNFGKKIVNFGKEVINFGQISLFVFEFVLNMC